VSNPNFLAFIVSENSDCVIGSEMLFSTSYILADKSSIPFYSISNGYNQKNGRPKKSKSNTQTKISAHKCLVHETGDLKQTPKKEGGSTRRGWHHNQLAKLKRDLKHQNQL